jgi:lipopolysaccharide export system protein LptA
MKYKITFIAVFILILLTGTALAKPIINANNTYFDFNTGLYVLEGNVYIEANNRVITAGQAKVNVAAFEVWGSGGITVTQGDIYFSGNSVYVYGNQNYAKIDGGVKFTRTNTSIIADRAEYNWGNRIAVFNGNVQVTQNGNTFQTDSINYNVDTDTIL